MHLAGLTGLHILCVQTHVGPAGQALGPFKGFLISQVPSEWRKKYIDLVHGLSWMLHNPVNLCLQNCALHNKVLQISGWFDLAFIFPGHSAGLPDFFI